MKKLYILSLLTFILNSYTYSQVDNEFWFVVPEVSWRHASNQGEPTFFRISSLADTAVIVKIEMPAIDLVLGYDTIPKGECSNFDLTGWIRSNYDPLKPATGETNDPNRGDANDNNIIESGLPSMEGVYVAPPMHDVEKRGILITSRLIDPIDYRKNRITVYLDRFNYSNKDIFSLKGENALGESFTMPGQNFEPNANNLVGSGDPHLLSGFDIVATEDATLITIRTTQPIKKEGNTATWPAGTDIVIELNRGETFSCIAEDYTIGAHLGGSTIESDKPIAVTWKDDSLKPDQNGGWDLAGDQLIPDKLGGKEYIVMRGELTDPEYAYVTAVESGTTTVKWDGTDTGGTPRPGSISLTGRGNQKRIRLNGTNTINALHILADKKVMVTHITGFGSEVGGAVVPTIDLCTGSKDVSVIRSKTVSSDNFYINIMTEKENIGDFKLHINGNTDSLNSAWFKQVGTTNWYYLQKTGGNAVNNNFTNAKGTAGNNYYIHSIGKDTAIRVTNTGRFHMSVIEGGGPGCKYGYFSKFSTDSVGGDIGADAGSSTRLCYGDTVILNAYGGEYDDSYTWWFLGDSTGFNGSSEFITDSIISNPLAVVTPNGNMLSYYKVKIHLDCPLGGASPDTIITREVKVKEQLKLDFSSDLQSPNCCSPVEYKFTNIPQGWTNYFWTIENEGYTTVDSITESISNPMLFKNTLSNSPVDYTIQLAGDQNGDCPDTLRKTITINPEIIAKATKGPKVGCQQDVTITYSIDTNGAGPITNIYWNFGDGNEIDTLVSDLSGSGPYDFTHTFENLYFYDTTYYVTLVFIDDVNGCCDTLDAPYYDTVFVAGVARARYSLSPRNGCSPLNVNISNNTYGDVSYKWWINNTHDFTGTPNRIDTITTDILTFINDDTTLPKEYYIFLEITKHNPSPHVDCTDTYGPDTIIVYPEFITTIAPAGPMEGCNPDTIDFSQTTLPNVPNLQYEWDFVNGTSGAQNPPPWVFSHTSNTDQNYQVSLITTSEFNCKNTAAPVDVKVYAFVDAKFTVAPDTVGCAPLIVTINNNSSVNTAGNFVWYPGSATGSPDNNNPFNLTYNNTTGLTQTHTLQLSDSNNFGCKVIYQKEITVFPEITARFIKSRSDTLCNNDPITFNNSSYYTGAGLISPGPNVVYFWEFGDGTTSSDENPVKSYKNTESSIETFPVKLTLTVNGCTSIYRDTVRVYSQILARINTLDVLICAPDTIQINNTSLGASNYSWQFSDETADRTTTNLNPIDFIVNNANLNDTIHIRVYITANSANCTDYDTIALKVYPTIIPLIKPDVIEGCGPLDVNFTNSTTGGNGTTNVLTYKWDFGNSVNSNLTTPPTQTFTNRTAGDNTYQITLVATNEIGCLANHDTSVTVYSEIEAEFSFNKNSECSPMPVFIENGSLNGTVFQWDFDFDNNTLDTTGVDFYYNFHHTNSDPNIPDVYNIQLIVFEPSHSECADTITYPITINPPVVANFAVTDNNRGCSPLPAEFTNSSTGYGLTYVWDYNDQNTSANDQNEHTHIFDNLTADSIVYNIKLTAYDANGCPNVDIQTVTAYPKVVADFTFIKDFNEKCTPYPVHFSYPQSAINGNKFEWDYGFGGNTDVWTDKSNFDFTFDNSTANTINNYTIQLISTDIVTGCTDTTERTIEVYPRLLPGYAFGNHNTFEGCNPLTVSLVNTTTGLADYLWYFDDEQSSSDESPTHIFKHYENNDKEFNVKLTTTQSATGCVKDTTRTVTVYSYLNPKFGILQASNGAKAGQLLGGCSPFAIQLTDSSTCNDKWHWNFGDGTSFTDLLSPPQRNLTYYNNDNSEPLENEEYTIILTIENTHACTKTTEQTLEVYPRSIPGFNVNQTGCHPLIVDFENVTTADRATQYYWILGDGATAVTEELTHTYYNSSYYDNKIFDVTLFSTTSNLCSDSITKQIIVYPKPLAAISPELDRGCSPLTAILENASKGMGLTFYWDFDNGITKETHNVTTEHPEYINNTDDADIKNVELIVKSGYGCRDTVIQIVNVYPEATANFSYYDPSDTAGCSPLDVEFLNLSNATSTVYRWDFGNGTTSQLKDPTYRYINNTDDDQVYTVTLDVESEFGCESSAQDEITVYLSPNAEFLVTDPIKTYPDTVVEFQKLVKPGPWTYGWDYGDNFGSNNSNEYHEHVYFGWGPKEDNFTYTVWLKAYSEHCTDSIWQLVTINPPNPYIYIDDHNPMGCVPKEVDFTVNYGFAYEESILWTFGDGSESQEVNPTYIYEEPGVFIAMVKISGDGGSFIDTTKVVVYPLPKPSFEFTPDFVMLPDQPVQFFNTTYLTNDQTYLWDFGDDTYSTAIKPWHQYTYEGVFDVKMVATSKHGCMDSVTVLTAVEVSGEGYVKFPNAFMPSASSPSDGSYDSSNKNTDVFYPAWAGVKDYELWIFNRWGEQLFYSDNIYVGWNGRFGNNGNELGQDVFFWKAKGKFNNDVPFKVAGDVTLIRR